MAFTLAAPNAVHYNGASVKQIDVPSFSGSFGILPAHVPSLAVLKPGVLTVFEVYKIFQQFTQLEVGNRYQYKYTFQVVYVEPVLYTVLN